MKTAKDACCELLRYESIIAPRGKGYDKMAERARRRQTLEACNKIFQTELGWKKDTEWWRVAPYHADCCGEIRRFETNANRAGCGNRPLRSDETRRTIQRFRKFEVRESDE